MKKNSLQKKLLHYVVLVLTLFLIGIMYYMGLFQKQLLIQNHKESLQLLANEKASQVSIYLDSQKEKYQILASMNVFREAVKYPSDSTKTKEAIKRIDELKKIYPGMVLLTNEGIIVVAQNNPAGTNYSGVSGFPANDESTFHFMRYYDQVRKKDYFGAMGPIYDRVDTTKVIGIIGYDIELEKVSKIMEETLDSETNETYLIDETGLLLSHSEYVGKDNKNGVLIQEVESDGAIDCLEDLEDYFKEGYIEEHEEVIGDQYKNYMGDDVFGAHAYVPSIKSCVITEKSVDEVLGKSMEDYLLNLFNK
jgi:hypothetical protein